MGVSFTIAKKRKKCKVKPVIFESTNFNESSENSSESFELPSNNESNGKDESAIDLTGSSISAGRDHSSEEDEVSFILNLYQDGYTIVKASENDNGQHATFQDGLKLLRPYDRTSEGFFAAIESGRLPSGILDDIPCKFIEGAIMCEVRDYRKCIALPGSITSSPGDSATISKVRLKMSLENVVKDISLMADDSWTYGDLMEVESRILNALQPKLCLDPVPRLDRLYENPDSLKINLGLVGLRKRRLRQTPAVTVTSNNRQNEKKICIEQAPNASYGDVMSQQVQDNIFARGSANQRTMHDPVQGHILPPGASSAGQDMPIPYEDNMNSAATKVVSQEGQLSPYSTFNNGARPGPGGPDGIKQQHVGSFLDAFQKVDPNMVKADTQMEAEVNHMDPRVDQGFQNPLMRHAYHQAGRNDRSQQIEKDLRKKERFSKSKSIQSLCRSAAAVAQSPLSLSSAEMSAESMGEHCWGVSLAAPFRQVVREKSGGTSKGLISFPKNPATSALGSSVSLNTMGGRGNSSNLSISTPKVTEHNMLERFTKIEMVAMRHQLNFKKNKVDEFSRKPRVFSCQGLLGCLAGSANNEYDDGSREMSRSLVGGHINVCKMKVVSLLPDTQGNMLPAPVGTRMILSEKPDDSTVAMHYGELTDEGYLNAEDNLPTLPNTHWADLLAEQFCTLIIREGYTIEEVIRPRPLHLDAPSNSQSNASEDAPNNSTIDTHQYSEPIESKSAISNTSLNSTTNPLPTSGMHPPGNSYMPQGHVADVTMPTRPQPMAPQQPLQQPLHQNQPSMMQQVPPQFQRSPPMLPNNSMPQLNAFEPGSNLLVGNQMGDKMLLQPVQQSQPAQMQRRMMMDLGTAVGMGNFGNNMGLGGLGAAGISTTMGSISGMGGNMGQNPMGLGQANIINQHLRAGTLSPQALVAAQRFKTMQNRATLPGTQSGIAGAARQMQPGSSGLSMLGQSLNQGNIGHMQRTARQTQMSMQKLMPGMHVPFNQQQFQHLQQMQQIHQQQPRQHALTQQEAMSPLQAVLLSQQDNSPSTLAIPQQMNQQYASQHQGGPQQMGQRTPMIPPLSSEPMHPSGGNPDACPASPALSSQTLGSVGSITDSPMDLHGVNKSNSITNT